MQVMRASEGLRASRPFAPLIVRQWHETAAPTILDFRAARIACMNVPDVEHIGAMLYRPAQGRLAALLEVVNLPSISVNNSHRLNPSEGQSNAKGLRRVARGSLHPAPTA